MINQDDITIYDSSIGFDNGKEFKLEITSTNIDELVSIRKEILDNQEIVERLKKAMIANYWSSYMQVLIDILSGDKK